MQKQRKPQQHQEKKLLNTGINKPVFDESDIVKPSNNNKPNVTKPTTTQTAVSNNNSSKEESLVTETPVLDESDIVSDPKDKEQVEFDADAWMDSEGIPTENNNSTEADDVENTKIPDEPEKLEESEEDKPSQLPLYVAVAVGTTAVVGGIIFYFLKLRKRKW